MRAPSPQGDDEDSVSLAPRVTPGGIFSPPVPRPGPTAAAPAACVNTDPTPPLCSGTLGPETGPECPSRTVSPRLSPSLSPALARAAARSRCSQFSVASSPSKLPPPRQTPPPRPCVVPSAPTLCHLSRRARSLSRSPFFPAALRALSVPRL